MEASSSTLKGVASSPSLPHTSSFRPPLLPIPHNRHHTVEISSVKCFVSPHRACGETQRCALMSALLHLTFSQKTSTLEGRRYRVGRGDGERRRKKITAAALSGEATAGSVIDAVRSSCSGLFLFSPPSSPL